ncbi:short-chain dehydrogenase [Xylariaceae sp. FL1019]|nr:short-chain dehydrogenase [Xylariaceae sp. FL1019]
MGSQWSQFFPPTPHFTSIPSLQGKIFIITGGASGIGYELSRILYNKNARVYIAGRSETKAHNAISEIQETCPKSNGALLFLQLDLDDLESIKAAVDAFKSKESKLHVLWNNAGISRPPLESSSKQGIELQLATNCLGPFLFTELLIPLLQATAAADSTVPGSVRVVWTSSQAVELSAPKGGFDMSDIVSPPPDATKRYINSKTGNIFLAAEFSRRYLASAGIISVATNPGAALTNLFRHTPSVRYLAWPLLYKADMAAQTQLFAGLSDEIPLEQGVCYIVPWGRVSMHLREDLVQATKLSNQGGSGRAKEFWDFCEEKTSEYR